MLKSQDILIALKLVANQANEIGLKISPFFTSMKVGFSSLNSKAKWTFSDLAKELFMSSSEVHAGYKRAVKANLINPHTKKVNFRSLEEFLTHGIQYVFPGEVGGVTRGLLTGHAIEPLKSKLVDNGEMPPVWSDPEGQNKGLEFKPLYKSVPKAAKQDQNLYLLLALVDSIRGGRAREKAIAINELKSFFEKVKHAA